MSHPETKQAARQAAIARDYLELLERLSEEATRQKQAILERQPPAINASLARQARLLCEQQSLTDPCPAEVHDLVRQVRRRLALNQTLLRNGMLVVDHLFADLTRNAGDSVLLSETV